MLTEFKNLDKDNQYILINSYIKKIQNQCILLKETGNQELFNSIPLLVETTVNLIFFSDLSESFKKLLIEEINLNIKKIKKDKTR